MKNMKNLLAIALVLSMIFCLCACGAGENKETEPAETEAPVVEVPETTAAAEEPTLAEGMAVYTITVVDEGGNPVAGTMVQLCKETCIPGLTNEEGVAQFTVLEDEYKVSFTMIPAGYEAADDAAEFYFDGDSKEMTLVLKAVA